MRHIVVRALKEIGLVDATFLEAADGAQALRTIREARPDLVVSDFNMPEMSGMELLRALAAEPACPRFGFVTSEASPQVQQEAHEAGACFVITKPFTASTLGEALLPVLSQLGRRTLAMDDDLPEPSLNAGTGFPKAAQVAGMLHGLLRRAVTASPAPPIPLPPRDGRTIVEYRRDGGDPAVACGIFDVPFAARAGAAFSLIPALAAAEMIVSRRLTDVVAENLHEVLNVMSRLLDSGGSARISLGPIHRPGEPLARELAARIAKPGARIDLCVEIAGYGKGNLTLLSLG
jgi:two-component system chemotaxis response regulator CheY